MSLRNQRGEGRAGFLIALLIVGVAFFVNPGTPRRRDLPTAKPPDHV